MIVLKAILATLFLKSSQAVATVTPDPRWTAYKRHLAEQRALAARELAVGFVAAAMEREDIAPIVIAIQPKAERLMSIAEIQAALELELERIQC